MISNSKVEQKLLRAFPFLDRCDSDLHDQLLQTASLAQLSRHQHICHEGRECPHLALLLSGVARVYKLGENGREITLYRVGPGQSCILTASCIINGNPFPAFAICEQDIEAVVIPNGAVKAWLADYASWRNYLFGLIAERLTDIISVVEEVVFRRMDRRIAGYLLKRAEASTGMPIKATHQQIASDLGTSREVVSRILKDFESNALIQVSRGTLRLTDLTALQQKARM